MRGEDVIVGIAEDPNCGTLPAHDEGWHAILSGEAGDEWIVGFVPDSALGQNDDNLQNALDTAGTEILLSESINATNDSYRSHKDYKSFLNYRSRKPFDLIPGDISYTGVDGNFLHLLRGGENRLGVSEICQIIQYASDNLTRVVSDNMQFYTSWGTIEIVNENNGTVLKLKGNSEHLKGAKEENYNFELCVGACPNNSYITMTYYPKEQENPVVYVITNSGIRFFETPADDILRVAGNRVTAVGANDITVVEGLSSSFAKDKVQEYENNHTETVGKLKKIKTETFEKEVGKDETTTVQGKSVENITGNKEISSSAKAFMKVSGAKQTILGGTSGGDDDLLVTRPHLDDFDKAVDALVELHIGAMVDIIPAPLSVKVPTSIPKLTELFVVWALLSTRKTNNTVAK
jgi:hypothetical protein